MMSAIASGIIIQSEPPLRGGVEMVFYEMQHERNLLILHPSSIEEVLKRAASAAALYGMLMSSSPCASRIKSFGECSIIFTRELGRNNRNSITPPDEAMVLEGDK